jgi:glycosyltransferase involved in cell wall biosynthesis
MDKIAILIPCFNENPKYLDECIQSAIDIDYENKDIIILDDGSDKNFLNNYSKYLDKNNIYLFSQINQKLPQTLNNLFYLSQNYDYITWGSSDNIWGVNFIKKHLEELKKYNADISYSDYYIIDENSNYLNESTYRSFTNEQKIINNRILISPNDINNNCSLSEFLFSGNNFIGCSFLIKKKVFNNYINLDGIEDYLYWISCLINKFKFIKINTEEILYKYRIHNDSATSKMMNHLKDENKIDNKLIMLKKHLLSLFIQKYLNWDLNNLKNIECKNFYDDFKKFLFQEMNVTNYDNMLLKITTIYNAMPSLNTINNYDLDNLNTIKTIIHLITNKDKNEIMQKIFPKSEKLLCNFIVPTLITNKKINILLLTQCFRFGGLENVMKINSESSSCFNIKIASYENTENKDIISFNSSQKNLIEYLNKNKIDILDCHYTLFDLSSIKNLTSCKVFYTNHNSYFWLDENNRKIIKNNDKFIDIYVNVSQSVLNTSTQIFKNDIEKSYIINNGIDYNITINKQVNLENIINKNKKILCVASLLPDKGQFELVQAFHNFLNIYPDSILVLLGKRVDINYVNKIINYINKNNLINNVILTECQSDEVINYINIADLCVLTSFVEGCSQAVKEWISNDKKIIVSDVGSNIYLKENFKNIDIIPVPFSINDINTQEKYFNFLFNDPKLSFIKLIEKSLLENINKSVEENTNLELISSKNMNNKKEILYYSYLKNNNKILKLFK